MTDGEKMVWAASFAFHIGNGTSPVAAAELADASITLLRCAATLGNPTAFMMTHVKKEKK